MLSLEDMVLFFFLSQLEIYLQTSYVKLNKCGMSPSQQIPKAVIQLTQKLHGDSGDSLMLS